MKKQLFLRNLFGFCSLLTLGILSFGIVYGFYLFVVSIQNDTRYNLRQNSDLPAIWSIPKGLYILHAENRHYGDNLIVIEPAHITGVYKDKMLVAFDRGGTSVAIDLGQHRVIRPTGIRGTNTAFVEIRLDPETGKTEAYMYNPFKITNQTSNTGVKLENP